MLRTTPVWLALLCFAPLHGQTAIEAALGASRAATTTAPAKDMSKALNGLLGCMDKLLQGAQPQASSSDVSAVTVVSAAKMATPKADVRTYEDPKLIQPGMAYAELLQRFGPPSMELTTASGHKGLMYTGKDGPPIRVELQDGKVLAPEAPRASQPAPQDSSVIVLK